MPRDLVRVARVRGVWDFIVEVTSARGRPRGGNRLAQQPLERGSSTLAVS
jgi:hypothetical protein